MLIDVYRFASDDDATLSTISIDGKFEAFGLEDEYRYQKVAGETRIPAGHYRIGVRTVGGFHTRYSRIFGEMHHGMLQVMDVPNFEYILLHIGNTPDDTRGCLLVGTGAASERGQMMVTHSRNAYMQLYSRVIAEAMRGELTIRYIDGDH